MGAKSHKSLVIIYISKCSFFLGIEGFNSEQLKPTETNEKIVLPASSDIQAEKTHQGLIQGVESFSSEQLKNVKTREPQSPSAILQVQIIHPILEFYPVDFLNLNLGWEINLGLLKVYDSPANQQDF